MNAYFFKRLLSAAISTGQRNTRVKSFCRGFKVQCFLGRSFTSRVVALSFAWEWTDKSIPAVNTA